MYKVISSPLGNIKLVENDGFLISIEFTKEDEIESSSLLLDEVQRQLKSYFLGELKEFNLKKLNLNIEGTNFQKKVWRQLLEIPYGKVISYKEIAHKIGHKSSYRACGNANGKNKFPIIIPCHRVINSDGSIGGYSGGIDKKIFLLELEHANFNKG